MGTEFLVGGVKPGVGGNDFWTHPWVNGRILQRKFNSNALGDICDKYQLHTGDLWGALDDTESLLQESFGPPGQGKFCSFENSAAPNASILEYHFPNIETGKQKFLVFANERHHSLASRD